MKIKMLVSRAGPGFCDSPGDIIDVGEAEAERMIEAGQAAIIVASKVFSAPKVKGKHKK